MSSSRGKKKAKTHRIDAAIAALTPLGFEKKLIRHTVRGLVKVYGDNDAGWYFLEEDYYKLVIETMIKDQDGREQEKSIVVHEEQDVENEEGERQASEEAMIVETSGLTLLQLEAGSSSNRGHSSMVESSAERALINLEECCDKIPGIELSQSNPSSVPKRRPCYGWISEDED